MFDPTTPETELPQPPRDPYPTTPEEAFVGPEDGSPGQEPAAPQEAPETPLTPRAKIGITFARTLDERARVMQERGDSFRALLASVGVTDANAMNVAGVRATYTRALAELSEIDVHTDALRLLTAEVRNVFETL